MVHSVVQNKTVHGRLNQYLELKDILSMKNLNHDFSKHFRCLQVSKSKKMRPLFETLLKTKGIMEVMFAVIRGVFVCPKLIHV